MKSKNILKIIQVVGARSVLFATHRANAVKPKVTSNKAREPLTAMHATS